MVRMIVRDATLLSRKEKRKGECLLGLCKEAWRMRHVGFSSTRGDFLSAVSNSCVLESRPICPGFFRFEYIKISGIYTSSISLLIHGF